MIQKLSKMQIMCMALPFHCPAIAKRKHHATQLSVCGYHVNHNLWLLVREICHLFKENAQLQQIKSQNCDESLIVDTFFINERKNDSGQKSSENFNGLKLRREK